MRHSTMLAFERMKAAAQALRGRSTGVFGGLKVANVLAVVGMVMLNLSQPSAGWAA